MDLTIHPKKLSGTIRAIPSKSQAHRLLICAAFSDKETQLICPETNRDIEATANCLRALGAHIRRTDRGYTVTPVSSVPAQAIINCDESGSTLRFMLPIVGALGVDTTLQMSGRLPDRPLSPMWEEMERMGCSLSRPTKTTVRCQGRLNAGQYTIDGSISSQFITGLLFAMALLPGSSTLSITGKTESKPYITMTQKALSCFGVDSTGFSVTGKRPFTSPGTLYVEGDWSNAAFFIGAKKLCSPIDIVGLNPNSAQGDRVVADILERIETDRTVDCADIPDLVPILSVVAGASGGATFKNIGRLRLKESDRVESVAQMLIKLGCKVEITQDTLTVHPGAYHSCTIDAVGDHRIAMAAAIAAIVADGDITIIGAQCVEKSYPSFWEEYEKLGGSYEQHIR